MNLCIHGHFYQPPREDPISNYIPSEIGAEPFNNWNEKILAECYEPNALAGNFGKISFNIGPTLFRWMWGYRPDIAQKIVDQEKDNFDTYGVGNGMAQSCHHTILPLATPEDRITQVYWGMYDFEFRFGHKPEGIWLPETGADINTLCVLSDLGIKFTILAPWQVRSVDGKPGPYLVDLPGGRKPMIVFPYQRELSTMVSFIPSSTQNGDQFLQTIRERLAEDQNGLNIIARNFTVIIKNFATSFLPMSLMQATLMVSCGGPTRVNGCRKMRSTPGQCWYHLHPGLASMVWIAGRNRVIAPLVPIGKRHFIGRYAM